MTEYQCDVNSFAGYSLGYSKSSTFLKSFCISGLILNLGLASFTTYHLIKKRKRSKSSSLDQILDILSIIEVVISFLWLINVNSFFKLDTFTYGELDTKCSKCKQIAGGFVLFYVFDWSLVALSVRQLKTIIVNPLDAILKPKFQLLKYFITFFIILCVSLLIYFLFDIHGISVSYLFIIIYITLYIIVYIANVKLFY